MRDLGYLRAIVIDVDGVMTDGRKYYSDDGSRFVSFSVKDGVGFAILKSMKITPIVISASNFVAVELRMKDLGVEHYYLNCVDKLLQAEEVFEALGIPAAEAAVIGDDLPDLPLFSLCSLAVAPADAVEQVRRAADIVLSSKGGYGVVREFVDLISSDDRPLKRGDSAQ